MQNLSFFGVIILDFFKKQSFMCGFFGYVGNDKAIPELAAHFDKVQHRGPDYSEIRAITRNVCFGFHRLSINGLNKASNQPMHLNNCWLIANAEIYNYKELGKQYGFDFQTNSDCEVIIHMYKKFGIERTVKELDAEFAFMLYDELADEVFVARDHLGVRGMYIGQSEDGTAFGFASEAKALVIMDKLSQFHPS